MRPLTLCFLVALTSAAGAQESPLRLVGGETFTARGASGDYPIHVVLPPGYDAERAEPYPVLYYADAWWLTELVAGVHRVAYLSNGSAPALIEPVVLVGVGVNGDAGAWNRQRNRDLTPSPIRLPQGVSMNVGGVAVDSASTGGAGPFLDFVEHTLIPGVEATYHVDPSRRGWLGHSFGGLFGAWALQMRPDLFRDALLVAPSAFWRSEEVIGTGYDGAARAGRRVFVAYGGDEDGPIRDSVPKLVEAMTRGGLSPTLGVYEGRDHASVLMPALWDGLVALYGR